MRISDWSSDVCSSDLLDDLDLLLAGGLQVDRELGLLFGSGGTGGGRTGGNGHRGGGGHAELLFHRLDQLHHLDEGLAADRFKSEEHTSELQSLMRISYAVFCLKKKKDIEEQTTARY